MMYLKIFESTWLERWYKLDALTIEDAASEIKAIMAEWHSEMCQTHDGGPFLVEVVEVTESSNFDIGSIMSEVKREREARYKEIEEKQERALYERLKQKYS